MYIDITFRALGVLVAGVLAWKGIDAAAKAKNSKLVDEK